MKLDAEVGVVGVGTMGSMCLWQLARRGVPAIGLEQFRLGHELGAGAGESRQFRAEYLEEDVRPIMKHALSEYRNLEADSGLTLLTVTGGLTIGNSASDLICDLLGRIHVEGDRPITLDANTMRRRYPQHLLADDDVVLWNAGSGFVQPERVLVAATRAAQGRGARVVPDSQVTRVEPTDNLVRLCTPDRTWLVRKAIITAGPWVWRLLPTLVPNATVGRLVLTWFPTNSDEPFTPQRFPTFTRAIETHTIYGMPSLARGSVRIGLVGPRAWLNDPNDLVRIAEPEEVAAITELVSRWMPDIVPTVIRTGVHMDSYTPDGQPLIGRIGESDSLSLAAAFSGRGFKMAPIVGRILADLALDGTSHIDIERWRPNRFQAS